jgi:DNA-binding transcriptional LysR family regulator
MDGIDPRDLECFAAVARARSFRRAARELRISVSGLSQRLRDLEERLGVRLLNRTTRSVAPTEAGVLLLGRIAPALRELADGVAAVRAFGTAPSGRLRINAPAPAVDLVLRPMVPAFLERFPDIVLEIVVEPGLVDIVAQGFDAGIRYEEHLAQDMIAVSLGPPERYVVVAAPALLARTGVPREPHDLLGRPCLSVVFPGGAVLPWEFEKDGRVLRLAPPARLTATHTGLLLAAAEAGLGFLMTFEGHVRPAVDAGRLVTLLDDWCPTFPGPFLYYPSRRHPPPALAAFIAFVREWRSRSASVPQA